jgi:tripartite-type tricarboxylate transporter receptor subunit TctC
MKAARRLFVCQAVGVSALLSLSRFAWAQYYPTRPVRIIVPFAAGGPQDRVTRLVALWLSGRLGQQFVVENRPGAGGNTGVEVVVKSPPDGYTLLSIGPHDAINATVYDKLNFDFIRDIAPVASISQEPLVMLMNPSVPARTVSEFIAFAKANPGKINMASPGTGTSPHLAGELFKMMTGVDMVIVQYRGEGPALTDLLGGQVQVAFLSPLRLIERPSHRLIQHYVGRLRVLAVTTATRSEALHGIPALGDFVPGYEASAWFGIGAPRNTPAEIVDKLNREINVALADQNVKARLADQGGTGHPLSPADFGILIAAETEKWGKVVRAANIKPG